jgi:exosortase/archaeosortase family protein
MTHGGATTLGLRSVGAFQILGWFAVLRLLYLQTSSGPTSRQDFCAAGVVIAINLLPSGKATWIAASLAAFYIYARSAKGSNGRAGASVLAALSVQSLWGPTLFSLFTVHILRADAALVGFALNLTRSGFEWHENVISSQDFSVGIYNGCSSFHNISLAALCWISLTKLHRPTFIKTDFKFAAAAGLAVIALNAARLYTISLGRENFAYWHDGSGAEIFAVASSFIIAAICAWGTSIDGAKHE